MFPTHFNSRRRIRSRFAGLALTVGTAAALCAGLLVATPAMATTSVIMAPNLLPSRGVAVVQEASRHAGKPYRHGAAGPHAFDCSGLTKYVYGRFGSKLPHGATAQSRHGRSVARKQALPGDLVLFGRRGRYYHAGIYAGNGYMWHASVPGRPVARKKIWTSAYTVRRLI